MEEVVRVKRAVSLLAIVMVASLGLASCEDPGTFPVRKAGAKCSPVGAFGRDKTHVLQCKTNKRWTRIMTISQARALIAAYEAKLAAEATTAPAPTTPPAPTTTNAPTVTSPVTGGIVSFGETTAPVGNVAGSIAPGRYEAVVPAGEECDFYRRDGAGNTLGAQRDVVTRIIMDLRPGDASVQTVGPCSWAPISSTTRPWTGSGIGLVNSEVAPGWYSTTGGPSCYWSVASSADGSVASIRRNDNIGGFQLVQVLPSDNILVSNRCGNWTALAGEPARYVDMSGELNDPLLQGNRETRVAPSSAVSISGNAAGVTVTAGDWTINLEPNTGGSFFNGAYFPNAQEVASSTSGKIDFSNGAVSCTTGSGSLTVQEIAFDGAGAVNRFRAHFQQTCTGQTDSSFGFITWDAVSSSSTL
ncbi:MAG TPA: hypothetical protein DEG43_03895 [Acidimicrobiaceae bacterium]|jgi:hypothetical protein|nr:hypothetical protein [Acidimicrobiaceae bacterium]